jgi:hypothetical protein
LEFGLRLVSCKNSIKNDFEVKNTEVLLFCLYKTKMNPINSKIPTAIESSTINRFKILDIGLAIKKIRIPEPTNSKAEINFFN